MAFDSLKIRQRFLQFFAENGHAILPSSALTDPSDPTLFFTNAGMNQFKDCFLGKARPPALSVATCQACMRAGGKHNDLDNVGHTKRHLTLFEMLGNFSFGSYFKREAIDFAWRVSTQVFELEPERISPTVYESDDEAFELWRAHVPADRIARLGKSENFWAMGQQGPCGPCSELLYDRGPSFGETGKPGRDAPEERYLEFWNLVFMQHDLSAIGDLTSLPQPMIDTGAGLERIALLKSGVDTVFETDILRHLIERVESLCGRRYEKSSSNASAFRVIADHARSAFFAISDGIAPSNVDRGYIIRKLIRRAARYGRGLGLKAPFLANMLLTVEQLMGPAYPRLRETRERVARVVESEEIAFAKALSRGQRHFADICQRAAKSDRVISGLEAFTLKDTYGLPFEDIAQLAQEQTLSVDEPDYRARETAARDRARNESGDQLKKVSVGAGAPGYNLTGELTETHFSGYTALEESSEILALIADGQRVPRLEIGQLGQVFLSKSPFYAERGGQIGDRGTLSTPGGRFAVRDSQFAGDGLIAHAGEVIAGELLVGGAIEARVDPVFRKGIARNHTAVHLLHWALGQLFGEAVKQTGSLVQHNRLRLDITLSRGLSPDDIAALESLVNEAILANDAVSTRVIPYAQAREDRAIKQLFGERYPPWVRLVQVGDSKELCGGTHCSFSGDIGYFRIVKEGGLAAGIRRIEALVGPAAHAFVKKREGHLRALASALGASEGGAAARLEQLLKRQKALELDLRKLKADELSKIAEESIAGASTFIWSARPVSLIAQRVQLEDLRGLATALLQRRQPALVILTRVEGARAHALIRLSADVVEAGLSAKAIWSDFQAADFRGGGSGLSAQGVGSVERLEGALKSVNERLSKFT